MHSRLPSRRGFTILELVVVVVVIALLMAILLPALGRAKNASKVAATKAEMEQIASACEQYKNVFGDYPGPVDDTAMEGSTVKFSGAQNLLLGLTRRFYPTPPTGTPTPVVTPVMGLTPAIYFDSDSTKQPVTYVADNEHQLNALIGAEPSACAYDAFMQVKPEWVSGQQQASASVGLDLKNLPCFIDSPFGSGARPILYYRQSYKWDPENAYAISHGGTNAGKFASVQTAQKYSATVATQATFYASTNSLVASDAPAMVATASSPITLLNTVGTMDASTNWVPRGGFVLVSAGVDRIYGTSDDIIVAGGN